LVDFELRRAHGADPGLAAARASYIAGFLGTSTVLAEPLYAIPIFGTMAHSFVQAHPNEQEAFVDFCQAIPTNTTLLIDTYDTLNGARQAAAVARHLAAHGIRVQRVRLDSGDLLTLSKGVRQILDQEGFPDIQIFASGDLGWVAVGDYSPTAPTDPDVPNSGIRLLSLDALPDGISHHVPDSRDLLSSC